MGILSHFQQFLPLQTSSESFLIIFCHFGQVLTNVIVASFLWFLSHFQWILPFLSPFGPHFGHLGQFLSHFNSFLFSLQTTFGSFSVILDHLLVNFWSHFQLIYCHFWALLDHFCHFLQLLSIFCTGLTFSVPCYAKHCEIHML